MKMKRKRKIKNPYTCYWCKGEFPSLGGLLQHQKECKRKEARVPLIR